MSRFKWHDEEYDLGSPSGKGYAGVSRQIVIQGKNTNVSSLADIWPQGTAINGAHTIQASAGVTLAWSSGSLNDAAAGTGLRTFAALIVDSNGKEQLITGTLNGQTKVTDTSGFSVRAVNAVWGTSWGSGGVNAGKIYFYDNSDTVTTGENQTIGKRLAIMDAGDNIGRSAWYTVPTIGSVACDLLVKAVAVDTEDSTTTIKYGTAQLLANAMMLEDRLIGLATALNLIVPFDLGQFTTAALDNGLPPYGLGGGLFIVPNGGTLDAKASASAATTVSIIIFGRLLIPSVL